jgi:hypothetical protein
MNLFIRHEIDQTVGPLLVLRYKKDHNDHDESREIKNSIEPKGEF